MSANYPFKNMSEVEQLAAPTENTKVFGFENGEPVQMPAEKVGKRRELVYEFTPGIDADGNPVTDVMEVTENVEGDLSWLLARHDSPGWEIELTGYFLDSDGVVQSEFIVANADVAGYGTLYMPNFSMDGSHNTPMVEIELYGYSELTSTEVIGGVVLIGGLRIGEDNSPVFGADGGIMRASFERPIKSIRIYKIYR